jgi:phage gp16-like protein
MPEAQYDPNKSPSWNEANKALHIAAKQRGATHETIHDAYTSATGKTSLADASRDELIKMYEALTKTKFKSSISPSGASKARPFARQ